MAANGTLVKARRPTTSVLDFIGYGNRSRSYPTGRPFRGRWRGINSLNPNDRRVRQGMECHARITMPKRQQEIGWDGRLWLRSCAPQGAKSIKSVSQVMSWLTIPVTCTVTRATKGVTWSTDPIIFDRMQEEGPRGGLSCKKGEWSRVS